MMPGQWRCDDGQCATAVTCDGELECRDGSDESLARCKGIQRPLFALILHCSQPRSSSSVSSHQVCPEACRRWPEYCYYAIAAENGMPGTCKLPPYPNRGGYSIEAIERATTTALADFTLLYSCPPGFTLRGDHPRCVRGSWTADFPSCTEDPKCQLKEHPSVEYECFDAPNHKCPEWVDSGRRVSPVCRPGYMRVTPTSSMYCIEGRWNYIATCQPAAHCFWTKDKGVSSPEYFAVGVGKIYRYWNRNDNGQKSDVSDIKVPPRFRGAITNYQDDIALVVLATRVVLTIYVRPVCLDFTVQNDELQLRPSNVGKIAVWNQSPMLKVVEMVSVDVAQCITEAPADFRSFITSDKICAAPTNGTVICKGDSGGGLAFSFMDSGVESWFLRGIASTAPPTNEDCRDKFVAFTQIAKHHAFITSIIPSYPQSKRP